MSYGLFDRRRRALSRVIVEIIMIVIAVAAASSFYYVWSTMFSSTTRIVSAVVTNVEGSASAGVVWITVRNTGNMELSAATLDYPSSGYTLSPTSFVLRPGESMAFTVTGTYTSGNKYYFHITLSGSGGSVGVEAEITMS